jgi:hypothetical protein
MKGGRANGMKAHSSAHLTFIWSARAALAVAALATTACGSDDTTSPADSGTDATTTTDSSTEAAVGSEAGEASVIGDAGLGDTGLGDAEAAAPLSFAVDIYAPIIAVNCIPCHSQGFVAADGGAVPNTGFMFGGLDMGDAAAAYTALVGDAGGTPPAGIVPVPADGGVTCASLADAGYKRVLPDDVAHSLFCNKVASKEDGGPPVLCGNPMPRPAAAPPLDPASITVIKAWINGGANP